MTAIAVARPVGEVLASLVPSAVATAVRRDDDPTLRLDAEEEAHIATSVPKRRAEFRTVRECARDALAQLGLPRPRQIPEERGAPPWPEGIVGSMTHCHRYRAAAVARVTLVAALGIDAEPHEALPPELVADIATSRERVELSLLSSRHPQIHWPRLLFSAKESVYKAWYPSQRSWLGFEDVQIRFGRTGEFRATFLRHPLSLACGTWSTVTGKWAVGQETLVTAVCVVAGDLNPASQLSGSRPRRSGPRPL